MIGQLLDGRYRLIEVLSSGAFGQTYLAADTRLPNYPQCVVKQLRPPSSNPRAIQIIKLLFKKKAESLEKLGRNDHIPQLLAYFEVNQEFYIVQEFIPGNSLTHEIVVGNPLQEERVIRLLQEILEILVFVHGNGVIHLDIKPDNLIRRQPDGKMVLINFGPIKEINSQILNNGDKLIATDAIPTSLYMPLEQLQGNPLFSSDIYAVGMIGIQLLSGLAPQELLNLRHPHNCNNGEFKWRLSSHPNNTLADILDKMVHLDLDIRYQSAGEVLDDLKKIRTTIVAPPPPPRLVISSQNTQDNFPTVTRVENQPELKEVINKISDSLLLKWRWIVGILGLGLLGGWLIFWWHQPQLNNQNFYSRGIEKLSSGDGKGAITEFNQALQANPSDVVTYGKRGNTFYDLGNYQQAIADYSQAIQLDPNNVTAYFNRGLARYDQKDPKGAAEDFTQVLRLKPNDPDAYYKRGLSYYDLQDYQTAIQDFTQAIQWKPNDAIAYQGRGLARSASGDKRGAIEDFTQAIRIDPKDADAYYSRGRARFFLADYQGAMEDYSQVININPKDAEAYANRGGANLNLKDYKKAIDDCTQAIKLAPKNTVAYDNRCIAYFNLGDNTKAIEDCTYAIQLNPNDPKIYSNRGLSRSAINDKVGAIADFTQAIRINPADAVSYTNRGTARYELKDYPKAIEDFTQALRLNPNAANALAGRGKTRAEMGDKLGAIEDLQKASSLCLDLGFTGCYQDAQLHIRRLQ